MKLKVMPNAVFLKEFRINSRSYKTMSLILIINSLLAIIGLLTLGFLVYDAKIMGSIDYSSMVELYIIVVIIQFVLYSVIAPGLTSGAISSERERQTLDMILTTRMKPVQIIMGKMYSAIAEIMLLAITSLPIIALSLIFGGLELIDLFNILVSYVVTIIFIGSIGIFFSTVIRKSVRATISTYGMALIVYFGPLAAFYIKIASEYYFNTSINMNNYTGYILSMLISPAITFGSLVAQQFSSSNIVEEIVVSEFMCDGTSHGLLHFVLSHWFICSIAIQLILSALLIFISSRKLNSVKKVKHK